jgi:signal transduction histidine kinase
MLLEQDSKKLEPRVRRNRRSSLDEQRMTISKTILDHVMEKNEGVLISDAAGDAKWSAAASIVQAGIREAICAPMQGRHSLVGVIYIDVSTPPHQVLQSGGAARFNDEHLRLLIAIGHQAALAVEDTRYYSAMVQAERLAAVGQAIACLSHHIKNILQGIRGGSYLIETGLSKHDENMVSKGWQFVEKNQDRISHLVMDMLTFSKERDPEMTPAELPKVVADVVELMETRAAERGVEVRLETPGFVPKLTFDPEGLHRAVLNVVSNAIDACDRDARRRAQEDDDEETEAPPIDPSAVVGHVTVSVVYEPGRSLVQVRVGDDGGGITPEDMEHIFSLFVSNKGNRGTGLGLPVSQKIMREHGGRILVESEPGHGATFILEMPAVLADVTRNLDAPPSDHAVGGESAD